MGTQYMKVIHMTGSGRRRIALSCNNGEAIVAIQYCSNGEWYTEFGYISTIPFNKLLALSSKPFDVRLKEEVVRMIRSAEYLDKMDENCETECNRVFDMIKSEKQSTENGKL